MPKYRIVVQLWDVHENPPRSAVYPIESDSVEFSVESDKSVVEILRSTVKQLKEIAK